MCDKKLNGSHAFSLALSLRLCIIFLCLVRCDVPKEDKGCVDLPNKQRPLNRETGEGRERLGLRPLWKSYGVRTHTPTSCSPTWKKKKKGQRKMDHLTCCCHIKQPGPNILPSVANNYLFIGEVGGWRVGDGAERRGDDRGENGLACEWRPLSAAVQETADTRLSAYAFPATVSASPPPLSPAPSEAARRHPWNADNGCRWPAPSPWTHPPLNTAFFCPPMPPPSTP